MTWCMSTNGLEYYVKCVTNNTDDCNWYPGTIDEDFGPFIVPMGVDLISNIYLTEN